MRLRRTYLGALHVPVALVTWTATALVIASTRHVNTLGVGMTPVHHVA